MDKWEALYLTGVSISTGAFLELYFPQLNRYSASPSLFLLISFLGIVLEIPQFVISVKRLGRGRR